jgi:hypothetical protein
MTHSRHATNRYSISLSASPNKLGGVSGPRSIGNPALSRMEIGRDRAAGWNPCSIRGRTLWIASASDATMNSNCRTAAEADMLALRARLKLEHLDLKRSRRSVATA